MDKDKIQIDSSTEESDHKPSTTTRRTRKTRTKVRYKTKISYRCDAYRYYVPTVRCSVADPDYFIFIFPRSWKPFLWVETLKFFDADPGSGMEKIRIRDKHHGSASLADLEVC
jgi:hypothetical protein